MKKKNLFWQMVYMCIIAVVMACFVGACSEDIKNELPNPPDVEQVGDVEFEIDLGSIGNDDEPSGSGDPSEDVGSASNPVNVETGDTLNVTVSQTSSYKDPDGSVYSVEPKASIELFAKLDTIYAKDLETLTSIKGKADVKTSTSGSNPVCHNTVQTFMVGTQEVRFDLMHEVYTYVNSVSQSIEMPYIKVNQADFGTANAIDAKKSNAQSPIRIKKVALTRAAITETNTFEVNVQFNVNLETVNTKQTASKSVSFNVKYMAVVEEVTELDGMLEYVVEGASTELKESYNVEPKNPFLIELKQKSFFASSDTTISVCNPVASFKMLANCDTVFVANLDSLSNFSAIAPQTAQDGNNPVKTTSKYRFNAGGGQSFDIETSYDVFAYDDKENLPYLMFGEPTKKSVSVTELNQTRAVAHSVKYYKVKTVFSVPVKSVNAKNPLDKELNFTVEYIGGVTSVTELDGMLEYTVSGSVDGLKTDNILTPKTPFALELKQKSYFASPDKSIVVGECSPVASFKMLANCDTVFVANLDSLSNFSAIAPQTAQDGNNPVKTTSKYRFNAGGGQSFDIETSYDVFAYDDKENLPYLMFGEPTKKSVSVTELNQTRAVAHSVKYYKVKTVFSVPVKSVNAKNPLDKELNFTVEYIGGVINEEEVVELDSITYRKDFIFYEASYNLPDRTTKVVYRDRNYSNGTVITDTIYSGTSEFAPYYITMGALGEYKLVDISYNERLLIKGNDTIRVMCSLYENKDANSFQVVRTRSSLLKEIDYNNFPVKRLSSKSGDINDYSLYKNASTRELFDETKPVNGWYFQNVLRRYCPEFNRMYISSIELGFYAYFLYIDDKIIDFNEYMPQLKSVAGETQVYPENETRGEALVFKSSVEGVLMNRNISALVVDTFYVAKSDTIINY